MYAPSISQWRVHVRVGQTLRSSPDLRCTREAMAWVSGWLCPAYGGFRVLAEDTLLVKMSLSSRRNDSTGSEYMEHAPCISQIATLLADPKRSAMMWALMDGTARHTEELALLA